MQYIILLVPVSRQCRAYGNYLTQKISRLIMIKKPHWCNTRPVYSFSWYLKNLRLFDFSIPWQPTQKNKFTFSEDWQHNCSCQVGLASGGIAAEAVPVYLYGTPNLLTQGTWQYPASNKLLLEAGGTVLQFTYPRNPQPGASDSRSGQGSPVILDGPNPSISILEQSTAFRFNSASNGYGDILTNQQNWRFLTTFTTGKQS